MIFLNPAVLFGLLAAAIPLLIHLFNKRKINTVEFSTLMFLQEIKKSKVRKIKIKQWLLLILRTIIIILLVLAFARPTLKSITFHRGAAASKTTQVFILDDTYSMGVITKSGSKFNQAKLKIEQFVENLQDGDEAALVSLCGEKISITSDLKNFLEQVKKLTIQQSSLKINEAVSFAEQLLTETENYNKEIVLLSDFQENIFQIDSLQNISKLENIKLYLCELESKSLSNITVSEFQLKNKILEENKTIDFTSVISNYAEETVTGRVASLLINGERRAQQSVNLEPGESVQLSFSTTLMGSGFVDMMLELEDDDITNDNRRFLTINIPEKISVLLLYNLKEDISYLKLALDKEVTAGNIELSQKPISQSGSVNINNYDVVFIVGTENTASVKRLIDRGDKNKFVVFPGRGSTALQLGELLKLWDLLSEFSMVDLGENDFIKFANNELVHPLFEGLYSEEKNIIDSPEITKYFKMRNLSGVRNILRLQNGDPFMFEQISETPGPIVFTIVPGLEFSNFPLKGIFAPLINRLVYYLSSNNVGKNIFAGESFYLNGNNINFNLIKIVNPDGYENILNVDPSINSRLEINENIKTPGNYRVYENNTMIDFFSVNVNTSESKFVFADPGEASGKFIDNGFTGLIIQVSLGDDLSMVLEQSRFGTELWKYLMLMVLLAAFTEMFVSKSAKKDFSELKGS